VQISALSAPTAARNERGVGYEINYRGHGNSRPMRM
jgi:hypothetical protein